MEGSNYIEGIVVESKNGIAVIKVGLHLLKTLGEYSVNSRLGVLIRPEEILLSKDAIKTSARNVIKAKVSWNKRNGKHGRCATSDRFFALEMSDYSGG